jgi:hypothetical protein
MSARLETAHVVGLEPVSPALENFLHPVVGTT